MASRARQAQCEQCLGSRFRSPRRENAYAFMKRARGRRSPFSLCWGDVRKPVRPVIDYPMAPQMKAIGFASPVCLRWRTVILEIDVRFEESRLHCARSAAGHLSPCRLPRGHGRSTPNNGKSPSDQGLTAQVESRTGAELGPMASAPFLIPLVDRARHFRENSGFPIGFTARPRWSAARRWCPATDNPGIVTYLRLAV